MKMRIAQLLICMMLVVGQIGCKKSKVIAQVGTERITEDEFNNLVCTYVNDQIKSNDILFNPAMREQRNKILRDLMNQKALLKFAKFKKIDQNPRVKLQILSSNADTYFQVLSDNSVVNTEPTEMQLRELYDEYISNAKMTKQDSSLLSFDQMRVQLPVIWKYKQIQIAREELFKQVNQRYPSAVLLSEYDVEQK